MPDLPSARDSVFGQLAALLPDPAEVALLGANPETVVGLAAAARTAGKRLRLLAVVGWSVADPDGPAAVRAAAARAGVGVAVEAVRATATDVASRRADGSIDAAVLAAGFDYWSAAADLRAWWPKVKAGGWLGGPGYGAWPGTRRAVDELLGPPTVLPATDFWVVHHIEDRDLRCAEPHAKVGVVTPHFAAEPDHFRECLLSVRRQTAPCLHYVVCDGSAPAWPDAAADVRVVNLPGPHGDVGNAARAVGGILAAAEGCDAVAFLDADNWFEPDHVESLLAAGRTTGAAVCSSGRTLHALDGQPMGPCPEVDGEAFVDTNCLFLLRPAFGLLGEWAAVPVAHSAIGDRFVWAAVRRSGVPRVHTGRRTAAYRTPYAVHYRHFGLPVPPGAKVLASDNTQTVTRRVGESSDAP